MDNQPEERRKPTLQGGTGEKEALVKARRQHTFVRVVKQRYGDLGLSNRKILTLAYLAAMPKETQEQWGRGELTNADIIKQAEGLK